MRTFEKIILRPYTDVDSQDGINTEQFLEATEGLINMFENKSLESLMKNEASLKTRPATEAILWLKRGLDFTGQSLMHSLTHPNDELTVSFMQAYDKTLRPYHSFIVRPLFNLAMNACPWRKDFYKSIDVTDEESVEKMKEWLNGLSGIIDQLNRVFDEHPEYTKH
ncbi:hypothetical protein G6F46_005250 [Rhizopus delemar]|uniref:Glycolipid transfer protein domain-containing protein n=2 Tax=Rhizopus TaxID=4842 RepID=A0A9P6Z2G3_9FUNG|nr:hypothetical protein G6F55_009729 [Rhizopus delemar]KAG1542551.1 hypothetical protein G6F51_007203 [Rhizopus arrhizus]KAG1496583.1 hypothetical protein G6F54_006364 [Rhizopus delemar]KAG1510311.1 hypothetical protein G6F53_006777 [Rhizopus delemar]KAG1525811.1 hypothetical protein G6F52_002995 [Rhizopus delemar]